MSFEGTGKHVPTAPASEEQLRSSWNRDELYGLSSLKRAAAFDKERTLDKALRCMMLQGLVTSSAVTSLACHVTLASFISGRTGFWSEMAKSRLNTALRLWDGNGQPSDFSNEAWRLFRMRMRREGALARIISGDISSPKQRSTRVAA